MLLWSNRCNGSRARRLGLLLGSGPDSERASREAQKTGNAPKHRLIPRMERSRGEADLDAGSQECPRMPAIASGPDMQHSTPLNARWEHRLKAEILRLRGK